MKLFRERYKPRVVDEHVIKTIWWEGGHWDSDGIYIYAGLSKTYKLAVYVHEFVEKVLVELFGVSKDKAHVVANFVEIMMFWWLGKRYFSRWFEW